MAGETFSKENTSKKLINEIMFLIKHHEEGGTPKTDLIKDADSLSYFEVNAEKHLNWLKIGVSKKQLREKMNWMFNRITSEKAKSIAKPMYKNAIKLLEDSQK